MKTIQINEADLEAIDTFAGAHRQPREAILSLAVRHFVENEAAHHESTLQGLTDIDMGRFCSHADVVKWAKSKLTDNPLPRPDKP